MKLALSTLKLSNYQICHPERQQRVSYTVMEILCFAQNDIRQGEL